MVDFRYHLVSILAVFLALAVGIVLGTTTIDDAVVADLRGRVEGLTKSERDNRARNDELSKRVEAGDDFARELLPMVLAGRLTGERVVIVTVPGGQKSTRDGLVRVIEQADGIVAGRLQIHDKLADPAAAAEIDDLMSDKDILPPGLELPSGSPVQRAAAVLAAVLATTQTDNGGGAATPTAKPTPDTQATTVLAAFREAGLVRIEGAAPAEASMFIVVAPPPPPAASEAEDAKVRASTEVVAALAAKSRAVVVAAPRGGAESNGLLSSIRRDPALASDVSSVDGADTTVGQIATVLALVERARGGFGHYGTGPGADDSALPDLDKLS